MPQQLPPNNASPPPQDDQHPPPRRRPGQAWRGVVDERIRAAQERGDFDNLPGAGKPLEIDTNPQAGDWALAYSLMKQHNVAPPEIELGKEVDALLAQAERIKADLRARRDQILRQRVPSLAEKKAYNTLRAKHAARHAALVREARSKGLTLNIIAPAILHRPLVDAAALIAAFETEFPPEPETA
jgi:hypothetical protein